jgi:hypothetical protein
MLSEVLQEDIINYMIIPYLSNIDIIKNLHLFSKKKQNEFHNNSRIIQSFFKRIPSLTKIMDIVEKYPTRKGLALLYGFYYPTEFVSKFHINMYYKKKNLLYLSNPWLANKDCLTRVDLYNIIRKIPVEHTLYIGW